MINEKRRDLHVDIHNTVYAKTTGSVYKSMETRIYTGLMEGNDIHTAPMAAKY